MVYNRQDQQLGTWIPVPILEQRRQQLRRQTIHSIDQRRAHLDESDRYSQFPRVWHTGRRFQRESLHRRSRAGGYGNEIWCVRSTNAKNGAVVPTFDQSTAVNLGGSIVTGGVNPQGLVGQIFLAVDRSGTKYEQQCLHACERSARRRCHG